MHLQPRTCRACSSSSSRRAAIEAAARPTTSSPRQYHSRSFQSPSDPHLHHINRRLCQLKLNSKRYYHSYDRPTPPPFPPAETAILSAALHHVPQHGFSTTALSLGAKDAGYLDISKNLFPRGVFDLINYHLATRRLALKYEVQFPQGGENQRDKSGPSVEEKVRALIMGRLRANGEVLGRWPEV